MAPLGGRRLVRGAAAILAAAFVIAAFVVGPAAAPVALATDLPPSQLGVNVYDLAGIWSATTRSDAQTIINGIHARTQAEVAVVSWPSGQPSVSLGGAQLDAEMIMNAWGVGRAGVNDGLVVLFDMDTSTRHGQIYLATGSGFRERYLSDSEAQAVVDGDMLPRARVGDFDGALLAGLGHLDRVVQPGGNPERTFNAQVRIVGAVLIAIVGLIVAALFLRQWWRQGRDAAVPLIDESVLLPEPPPGLTPALATVLREDVVTRAAFTSALVDLGHRGLVTFQEGESDKIVDLVVPPNPSSDDASKIARERPLGVAEHALAHLIALKASGGRLTYEDLKEGTGKVLLDDFKKHIGIAAAASGWFRADPNRLVGRWLGVGFGLVGVAFVLGFILGWMDAISVGDALTDGGLALLAALAFDVLVGLGIAVASRFMAARTESGAQTLAMGLAYRNTLRYEIANAQTVGAAVKATQQRLPWIKTPDLLTVWAVALGLNHEIDKFIQQTFEADEAAGRVGWAPLWFVGPGGWSSTGFGSFGGLAAAVASVSVSTTSSSGGGFGGGGFGGGGGGAGGGF